MVEFLDFRIMGVAYKRVVSRPPFSCCYGHGSDVEWWVHGGGAMHSNISLVHV